MAGNSGTWKAISPDTSVYFPRTLRSLKYRSAWEQTRLAQLHPSPETRGLSPPTEMVGTLPVFWHLNSDSRWMPLVIFHGWLNFCCIRSHLLILNSVLSSIFDRFMLLALKNQSIWTLAHLSFLYSRLYIYKKKCQNFFRTVLEFSFLHKDRIFLILAYVTSQYHQSGNE